MPLLSTLSFHSFSLLIIYSLRKIQTYQNEAKNLYAIYFVFDLDGECKFVKTKHLVIKEICSS